VGLTALAGGANLAGAQEPSSGSAPDESLIDERSGTPPAAFAAPGDTMLDKSKIILRSTFGVDLTHNSAALPLHRGIYRHRTVWFVITEASDFGSPMTSTSTSRPSSPTWPSAVPSASRT